MPTRPTVPCRDERYVDMARELGLNAVGQLGRIVVLDCCVDSAIADVAVAERTGFRRRHSSTLRTR